MRRCGRRDERASPPHSLIENRCDAIGRKLSDVAARLSPQATSSGAASYMYRPRHVLPRWQARDREDEGQALWYQWLPVLKGMFCGRVCRVFGAAVRRSRQGRREADSMSLNILNLPQKLRTTS